LAVWFLSQEWFIRKMGLLEFFRPLGEAASPGGANAGRVPNLHRIPWNLPYNWGKSQKTSFRVTEKRSGDHSRTRFVYSTWPSRQWPRLTCWPLPILAFASYDGVNGKSTKVSAILPY